MGVTYYKTINKMKQTIKQIIIGQKFNFTDKLSFYYGTTCIVENITKKSIVYSFGSVYNVSVNKITKQRYGLAKFNNMINKGQIKLIN